MGGTVAIDSIDNLYCRARVKITGTDDGQKQLVQADDSIIVQSDAQLFSQSFILVVNPLNDAPTISDSTVRLAEDQVYQFSLADIKGYSDQHTNDDEADALANITITSLPQTGSLLLESAVLTTADLPQVISVDQLSTLSYQPVADGNGVSYASFKLQVNDQGVGHLGQNPYSQEQTMTIDVLAVNDIPEFSLSGDLVMDSGQALVDVATGMVQEKL